MREVAGFVFGLLVIGALVESWTGYSPGCAVVGALQPMADVWRAFGLLATFVFLAALFLGDPKARFWAFCLLLAVFLLPELVSVLSQHCGLGAGGGF